MTAKVQRTLSWSARSSFALRPPAKLDLVVHEEGRKTPVPDLRCLDVSVSRLVVSGELRELMVILYFGKGPHSTHSVSFRAPKTTGSQRSMRELPQAVLDLLADDPVWLAHAPKWDV